MSRTHPNRRLAVAVALAAGLIVASTTTALAAKPEIAQGRTQDTFFDEFLFDLCGIETQTTVTEHWTLWSYADGSQKFQVSRKFVPEDRRIPIEYGAGMSTFAPDGTQTVHGSPLRLRSQVDGGIIIVDAGSVSLGDDPTVHGPHPSLELDLADLYCP
jgi:hypothetical protein